MKRINWNKIKYSKMKTTLGAKFEEFTKETTFHGVKYVFDGSAKVLRRGLWSACVIVVIILFVLQVYERSKVYMHHNTTISTNTYYRTEVPFPAVTLCNSNTFRVSVAGEENWYQCITEIFSSVDWNETYASDCPVGDTGFLNRSAHQLENFIFECKWNGKKCNTTEMFQPVWTDVGLCYKFNGESPQLMATETGTGQGLRLTLNIEADEYMAGPLSGAGTMVLLHDPQQVARMRDLAYAVSPGSHTLLAVQFREISDMESPWGSCVPGALPVTNCVESCNKRKAELECGCRENAVTVNDTLPECDDVGVLCILKKSESSMMSSKACNCSTPCHRREYNVQFSNSMLDMNRIMRKMEINNELHDVLTNQRKALDVGAKVEKKTKETDDALIDKVADTTTHLGNVVKPAQFNQDSDSDIRDRLFNDVCGVFEEAFDEMLAIAEAKICNLEYQVNNLTSLLPFEYLKVKICGGVCDAMCEEGFPVSLLKHVKKCFLDFDNFTNTSPGPNSDDWLEAVCFNLPADGIKIAHDEVQSRISWVSCRPSLACVRDVFTFTFNDFKRDSPDNLLALVDKVKSDFLDLHSILLMSEKLLTPETLTHRHKCMSQLDLYKNFAESFYDVVDYFSKNLTFENMERQEFGDIVNNFLLYVDSSDNRMTDIKFAILENCFWFEKYFWWRHTRQTIFANCHSNTLHNTGETDPIEEQIITNLDVQLRNLGRPDSFCELKKFQTLVVDSYSVYSEDPYNVFYEASPCFTMNQPGQREEGSTGSKNSILSSLILDPNNPLFNPITQIECYFYPMTTSGIPNQRGMKYIEADYKKPLTDIAEYIKMLKNISSTLESYRKKEYGLDKSQIAAFTLHPNINEDRVEKDLKYFQNLINQHSEETIKVYSKVGVYWELYQILNNFTNFALVPLDSDSLDQIGLFIFAKQLQLEAADIERCRDDLIMCNMTSSSGVSILTDPFSQLCYHTGQLIHNTKVEFDEAVKEYIEAYTKLNKNFRSYMNKWESIGDDFYQRNFLNLDIYYNQLSVEQVVQQPAFELLSLFSEIGGFLGLLLGASVLTVIEVFDFIFINSVNAFKNRKKNEKVSNGVESGTTNGDFIQMQEKRGDV